MQNMPEKRFKLIVIAACIFFILIYFRRSILARREIGCSVKETALGLFVGDSLSSLEPIDFLGVQGRTAWPVSNPVFTSRALQPYGFAAFANPALWLDQERLYLFFEATSCISRKRTIAVAESLNDGVSWNVVGSLAIGAPSQAKTPDAYAYPMHIPHLFRANNDTYLVTDSGGRGPALFKAVDFPLRWEVENSQLVPEPVRGVSVIKLEVAKDPIEGRAEGKALQWLLIGSQPISWTAWLGRFFTKSGLEDDHIVFYESDTPVGPFTLLQQEHMLVPRSVLGHAASPGGGVGLVRGEFTEGSGVTPSRNGEGHQLLVRIGRSCRRGVCGLLSTTVFEVAAKGEISILEAGGLRPSDEVPPNTIDIGIFGGSSPRARQARAWNGGEETYASMLNHPMSGKVIVVVSANPALQIPQPLWAKATETLDRFLRVLIAGYIVLFVLFMLRIMRRIGHNVGEHIAARLPRRLPGRPSKKAVRTWMTAILANVVLVWKTVIMKLQSSKYKARNIVLGAVFLLTFILAWAAGHVMEISAPYWSRAPSIPVEGEYSKFTLMTMTYDARRKILPWYIEYYGQCASVGEIVIVWNSDHPPNPDQDFPHSPVPVRVRPESKNSLNNRYKPDDRLRYRGVLILDDDLLVPCEALEAAFASWRKSPHSLHGFFPRLAENSTVPRYHAEPAVVKMGQYNLILSGAAFLDSRTAFPAYWADELAPARAVVNNVHNCDDILMNFVVANASLMGNRSWNDTAVIGDIGRSENAVQFIRPIRRIDVSDFSGVGLSHAVKHFLDDAELCLLEFRQLFGGWPLQTRDVNWKEYARPRCGRNDVLECSYMHS